MSRAALAALALSIALPGLASGQTFERKDVGVIVNPCNPDQTPPTLQCPAPYGVINEECMIRPPRVRVSDLCDPNPLVSMSSGALVGAGLHTIVYTATDASGNVATCATQVQLVCPGCVNAPADLLAWWALDETSGPIAIERQSGNHGTFGAGTSPAGGMVDGARTFTGAWPGVNAPRISGPHDYQDLTVAAWVRPSQVNGTYGVIDFGNGKYSLSIDGGEVLLVHQAQPFSFAFASTGVNLQANQWAFLAMTADSATGELRIYVDGQHVATNPNYSPTGFWNNGDWQIGNGFHGQIDEVQVYERPLSDVEILSLWEAEEHGVCK